MSRTTRIGPLNAFQRHPKSASTSKPKYYFEYYYERSTNEDEFSWWIIKMYEWVSHRAVVVSRKHVSSRDKAIYDAISVEWFILTGEPL